MVEKINVWRLKINQGLCLLHCASTGASRNHLSRNQPTIILISDKDFKIPKFVVQLRVDLGKLEWISGQRAENPAFSSVFLAQQVFSRKLEWIPGFQSGFLVP